MVRWRALIATLFVAFGVACTTTSALCPNHCHCKASPNGTIVNCQYQSLTQIPHANEFPEDTVELDYSYNKLNIITRIPNLPNLQKLLLNNCDIQTVTDNAFVNVPDLRNLSLSGNNIDVVMRNAFQGLSNLKGLYMDSNNLKVIPENLFMGLRLTELGLADNSIALFPDAIFAGLSVQHLNVQKNNIAELNANTMRTLRSSLVTLQLDNNQREMAINAQTFDGFNALQELSVSYCQLHDTAFLGRLNNLKRLDLSGNKLPSLKLNDYPNLATVKTLTLADMGLQTFPADQILSGFVALRRLDLSNNLLTELSGEWFHNTPTLAELKVANNKLSMLRVNLTTKVANIKSLDLSMNMLRELTPQPFGGLHNLQLLDIRSNSIQIFPEAMRPLFDRVATLHLAENPLHCNCQVAWYRTWLDTTGSTKTAADTCFTPIHTNIYYLNSTDFVCDAPTIRRFPSIIYATPNSDVYIECAADGDPAPTVTIVDMDGYATRSRPSWGSDRSLRSFSAMMKMNDVSYSNTGNCTCIASNIEGEVRQVLTLLVSDQPPTTSPTSPTTPTTPPTTSPTSTLPPPTTDSITSVTSAEQTTIETLSFTTGITSTSRVHATNHSPQTLAIVGVLCSLLVLLLLIAITVRIFRHNRYRRRYDVTTDRAMMYNSDRNGLNVSTDSKPNDEV